MTLTPGGRRLIAWTLVSLLLTAIYSFWPQSSAPPVALAAPANSVSSAEKQLAKLREQAESAPTKQEILRQASADLAQREKGIINADTPQQAQAQIIQILRQLGADENPRVEIRSQEMGPVRPFGESYGEVVITVQIDCGIDQLTNIMAALGRRPELIASNEVRIHSVSPKDKTISVRLTVSGIVPRKLVPVRKGAGS
ncbi:MAG TPA: GspMb/PilO family protein [Bryobacteraceae bacterium]|nr:GspMb/PilO family protein [Bryobacteraceae bacterium]